MAMDTSSGIARSARRLKDIATDKVRVPSLGELMDRKAAEIADAKSKLDAIVKKQLALDGLQPSQRHGLDALLADKVRVTETIERLSREAGVLRAAWRSENPLPKKTAEEVRAEALTWTHDPYANAKRGSADQIAAAKQAVDEIVHEYRVVRPTGNADTAMTAKLNAARLRLAALEGPPYAAYRPWASDETLKTERKKLGLDN